MAIRVLEQIYGDLSPLNAGVVLGIPSKAC